MNNPGSGNGGGSDNTGTDSEAGLLNLFAGHTLTLSADRAKDEGGNGGGDGTGAGSEAGLLNLFEGHTLTLTADRAKGEGGDGGGDGPDDTVPAALPVPHTLTAEVTLAANPGGKDTGGGNGPDDTVPTGLPAPHTLTAEVTLAANSDGNDNGNGDGGNGTPSGEGSNSGGDTGSGSGKGSESGPGNDGGTEKGHVPHHIRYQIETGSGLVEERPFLKCERAIYERYIGSVCAKLPSPTDVQAKLEVLVANMNDLADDYTRAIRRGKRPVAKALRARWNKLDDERRTQVYRVQIAISDLKVCRQDAEIQAEKQCKATGNDNGGEGGGNGTPSGEGSNSGGDTGSGSVNGPDDTVPGGLPSDSGAAETPHHINNPVVTGSGRGRLPHFATQCMRDAYAHHMSTVCSELPSTFGLEQKLWKHVEAMNDLVSDYQGLYQDLPDNGKSQKDAAKRWNRMERQRQSMIAALENNRRLHEQCRKDGVGQVEKLCKAPISGGGKNGGDDVTPPVKTPLDKGPGDILPGGKGGDYGIKPSGCKACDDMYLASLRGIAKDIRQQEREIAKRGYSGKMLGEIIDRKFELQKIDSPDFMISIQEAVKEDEKKELIKDTKKGDQLSIEIDKGDIKTRESNIKKIKKNRKKYQKKYDAARKEIAKLEKQYQAFLEAAQTLSDSREDFAQQKRMFEDCVKQCKAKPAPLPETTGDCFGAAGGAVAGSVVSSTPLAGCGDIISIGVTDVINHGGNDPLNPDDPVNPGPGSGQQNSVDIKSPVVTPPDPITVDAVDANGTPTSDGLIGQFLTGARASDNIGVVGGISNDAPAFFFEVTPNTPAGRITIVTFTARDAAGNTGTASSTVTVIDRKAPDLTTPAAITVMAGLGAASVPISNIDIQNFLNEATATDNVDSNVAVTNDAPASFSVGQSTVTFTATDQANQSTSGTSVVTIVLMNTPDTMPPVVTPPDPVTIAAVDANGTPSSDAGIAAFLAGATATDDRDGTVAVAAVNPPSQFPLGPTDVVFSATDAAGNTSTATGTLTVADQKPPDLTLPMDITLAAVIGTTSVPSTDTRIVSFLNGANATDNVDVTVMVTNNAPTMFPVGLTTVTFSAADAAGNAATGTSNVTVNAAPPVVGCSAGPVNVVVPTTFNFGYLDPITDLNGTVTTTTCNLALASTVSHSRLNLSVQFGANSILAAFGSNFTILSASAGDNTAFGVRSVPFNTASFLSLQFTHPLTGVITQYQATVTFIGSEAAPSVQVQDFKPL